jgi:hypothetical protein
MCDGQRCRDEPGVDEAAIGAVNRTTQVGVAEPGELDQDRVLVDGPIGEARVKRSAELVVRTIAKSLLIAPSVLLNAGSWPPRLK